MRPVKRVFKYGHFVGMDPVCKVRVAAYADTDVPIDPTNPEDWEDAQHQWVTSYGKRGCHSVPMQRCGEEGCTAVRPTPLRDYPIELQVQIMQLNMLIQARA